MQLSKPKQNFEYYLIFEFKIQFNSCALSDETAHRKVARIHTGIEWWQTVE